LDKVELQQYRDLVLEAQELEEEIEELRTKSESRKWPDGMPHSNFANDRLSGIVAKIVELRDLLEAKQDRIMQRRQQIEMAIEQLDAGERRLIRMRYVQGLGWEQIGEEINYSCRETHRKHSEALEKMAHYGT